MFETLKGMKQMKVKQGWCEGMMEVSWNSVRGRATKGVMMKVKQGGRRKEGKMRWIVT